MSNAQVNKLPSINFSIFLPENTCIKDFPFLQTALPSFAKPPFTYALTSPQKEDEYYDLTAKHKHPVLYTRVQDKALVVHLADINKIPQEAQSLFQDLTPWGSAFINCILR